MRAVFFPDNRIQSFDFISDVGVFVTRFTVEGAPCRPPNDDVPSSAGRVLSMTGTPNTPVVPVGSKEGSSINVKIIQGTITKKSSSGRPDVKHISQTFVDVNESTANVIYLSHVIKQLWGLDYILITADGMRIEDSSGTNGESSVCFYQVGCLVQTGACA